jgi:hypothetical protein
MALKRAPHDEHEAVTVDSNPCPFEASRDGVAGAPDPGTGSKGGGVPLRMKLRATA